MQRKIRAKSHFKEIFLQILAKSLEKEANFKRALYSKVSAVERKSRSTSIKLQLITTMKACSTVILERCTDHIEEEMVMNYSIEEK